MKLPSKIAVGLVGAIIVATGIFLSSAYLIGSSPLFTGALVMNYWFSRNNPAGTFQVELRRPAALSSLPMEDSEAANTTPSTGASGEWPSYNRTVASQRFSPLTQINAGNASGLKVLCSYDTGRYESFQTGIMMVGGALIGTTAEDIFSVDPDTCKENWRVHEESGLGNVPNNRGAAYLDGKLFRAFHDGYIRAYDAATGKRLWQTYLGKTGKNFWFTAAPVAWQGKVFFGTAGSHGYNIRGRVFALDAATGKAVWEAFTVPRQAEDVPIAKQGSAPTDLMRASWKNPPNVPISGGGTWTSYTIDPDAGYLYVPVGNPAPVYVKTLRPGSNLFTDTMLVLDARTGNYVKHYSIMNDDWHDWDVSNPPIIYTSRGGRELMSFHPKDGHLYSFDRASDKPLYRKPVTRIENTQERFAPGKRVRFCPGAVGGGEWNSAAFDPQTNLVFTGETDWCTTAEIADDAKVAGAKEGDVWFGVASGNPYGINGDQDPLTKWSGWLYATDADSGEWLWRARSNYPVLSGVTPTGGGIVAFGDMGGNFRILRSRDGKQLWNRHFTGAIAGGVITYSGRSGQRIALTSGTLHPLWPLRPSSGKVIILGL